MLFPMHLSILLSLPLFCSLYFSHMLSFFNSLPLTLYSVVISLSLYLIFIKSLVFRRGERGGGRCRFLVSGVQGCGSELRLTGSDPIKSMFFFHNVILNFYNKSKLLRPLIWAFIVYSDPDPTKIPRILNRT